MTLPVSGAISLNQVNVELGLSGTTTISMNQASVRTLFGVPSGTISMSNGYGKANQFSFTISSPQTNANLRSLAIAAGWGGASKVVATINSGVTISSSSTGSYALTINGAFPAGVSLTNSGVITGRGGNGGQGGGISPWPSFTVLGGSAGAGGGPALIASVAVSITNNNSINGGGGGGGGGRGFFTPYGKGQATMSGGGGGGGAGVSSGGPAGAGPAEFGTGVGAPGGAGTITAGAGGGAGGIFGGYTGQGGNGGTGGGYGAGGSAGTAGSQPNGIWNGQVAGPYSGGAGGAAIAGNANITWVAFGTRNGGIS